MASMVVAIASTPPVPSVVVVLAWMVVALALTPPVAAVVVVRVSMGASTPPEPSVVVGLAWSAGVCLVYTSDAADQPR